MAVILRVDRDRWEDGRHAGYLIGNLISMADHDVFALDYAW